MRSKCALELGFPELPSLGLMVSASVPRLVLEGLEWLLKLCCRDWREIEHQVPAGLYASSMSSVSGWLWLLWVLQSLALVPFPWRDLGTQRPGTPQSGGWSRNPCALQGTNAFCYFFSCMNT